MTAGCWLGKLIHPEKTNAKMMGTNCVNYCGSFPNAPCGGLGSLQNGAAPPTSLWQHPEAEDRE